MDNCDDILIVDDNADFRAFVSSVFERVGYATRQAETGEGALSAVREERPFCVLLDVHLPGLTGYQVCRELREEYGEELPIIFITGVRTEPADRVAGLLLGADDYVVKPFDPDELLARVSRFLRRSSHIHSQNNGRVAHNGRVASFELRTASKTSSSSWQTGSEPMQSPSACSSVPRRSQHTFNGSW